MWRANGAENLPLADRGMAWDADAAEDRVREWAGGVDNMDWAKYRRAFFAWDDERADQFGGYKLQFADIVNGELRAVPRGVMAVAAVLQGGRGGVDLPEDVQADIRKRVAAYYRKWDEEAPWERNKSVAVREGRVLSQKNRELIANAIRQSREAIQALQELLDSTALPLEERSALVNDLMAVRAIGPNRLGGYAMVWGGRDLYGTYFTPQTDVWRDKIPNPPLLYNHGFNPEIGRAVLGRVVERRIDEIGEWIEVELEANEEYRRRILGLQQRNPMALGWSTGSAKHLIDVADDGEIRVWPVVEVSLTPTPAEPRTLGVQALRSLGVWPPLEADSGATVLAVGESVTEAVAAEHTDYTDNETRTEDKMDEQLLRNVITEAVKPLQDEIVGLKNEVEALKREPVPAGGHVTVVRDPADVPFNDLAEFCRAVRDYTVTLGKQEHDRLRYLRATGASEGVPADGGFLVEPTLVAEIIKPLHEEGPFSRLARRMPVGSNSNNGWINGVDETSRATGSRWGGVRGYRLAEGGTITPSRPKFRRINWELKKYAIAVYATEELLADAQQFTAIVRQAAAEELAFMVNDDILNGDGSAGPLGILQSGCLVTVSKEASQGTNTIVTANLYKMWQRLLPASRANAVWFINSECEPQLDQLYLAAGTGSIEPRMVTYGVDGLMRIKGRPVVVTEFNAALGTVGDIVLADMGEYLFWEKAGVQSATSIHVQFLTDETVFRFIYRCDGQPSLASPVTPYKGTNTQSPFVALQTRS